jgi:hypothetical protein
MSVWTVQTAGGEDQRVEAGMMVTESGALIALSQEGLIMQAWAPGQWLTMRHIQGADAHPAGKAGESVLIELPRA